jgi:hypothetical protein
MQHLKERHDTLQVVWLNTERDSVRERKKEKVTERESTFVRVLYHRILLSS